MSISSETVEKENQSLGLNEQKEKIKLLRKSLLNCDDCCRKYIAAEDEILLRVLRVKSFNVQNAADAIEKVEKCKIKYPEVFSAPFEECAKAYYEQDILTVLLKQDKKGRTISHVKLKNWHPEQISLEMMTKLGTLLGEVLLQKEDTQINGVVSILDFKEVGLTQIRKIFSTITFHAGKRGNDFMKGATILKVKAVYIVNAPYLVVQLANFVKIMLSKKIKERFQFCDLDSKEFTSNFPQESLPKCLNGAIDDEDAIDWISLEHLK